MSGARGFLWQAGISWTGCAGQHGVQTPRGEMGEVVTGMEVRDPRVSPGAQCTSLGLNRELMLNHT